MPPVQLTYVRGPGAEACPGVEVLRQAVLKEMGHDPFEPSAARHLRVSIERRAGAYEVEMEMRDEADQRLWRVSGMRSRSACRTLVEAVALAVVIRIDPLPEQKPPPVCPPPPAPQSISSVAVPHDARPAVTPAPAVRPEPAWPLVMLGGGPLLVFEAPFSVAPGLALFGGVRWPHVSLALEARAVLPGTRDNQLQRIQTSQLAAVLAACAHVGVFFGCGLGEAGGLHPSGPDAPARVVVLGLLGAGVRAGVEWQLPRRLVLRLHADLMGTLSHEHVSSFPYDWNVPEAVGLLGVDLGVLFVRASPPRDSGVPSTSSTKERTP